MFVLPLWSLSTYEVPGPVPDAWDAAPNKIGQSSLSLRLSGSPGVTDNKWLVNQIKPWKMIKALGKMKQEGSGAGQFYACKDRK